MQTKEVRLGLCFFDNQLLYAVSNSSQKSHLEHIGAIDFNFSLTRALFEINEERLSNLRDAIGRLKKRFDFTHLNVLLHPRSECRTVLPKLVYDNAEEREAHINILMNGVKRKHIHTAWHGLSNEKYKLLTLQTDQSLAGIQSITNGNANIHLLSTFEIGERWINHARPGGSFLSICCYNNCIAVSSFILGKLRGATYICFDDPDDLPYFWLQRCQTHLWMKGLHEQIQIYGNRTDDVVEILKSFLDDTGAITKMNSLKRMRVTAPENTYGFALERAYPAILMALDL